MSTRTDAWIELARQVGRERFLARHPGFFLVLSDELDEPSEAIFETQVVDFTRPNRRRGFSRDIEIRWIVKRQDNPFADRISIGRARNCDLTLRHPSVSGVHAHFRIDGDRLTLTDKHSRNGTFVNGERLVSDQSHGVHARDRIRFGQVGTTLYDAERMFDLLSRVE